MKLFKSFFVFVFFFSCLPKNTSQEPITDPRNDRESDNRRVAELRRLRNPNAEIIKTNIPDRYEGGAYGDFEGEKCEESEDCKKICDDLLERKERKCYKYPEDFVTALEPALYALVNISDVDNTVDISPSLLAGILDLDEALVKDKVEDEMSEGDLKSFLAWVAINEGISKVLFEERGSDIVEKAFEKLGESQPNVKNTLKTGLNVGLLQDIDSFFYLSSENFNSNANSAGFEMAYGALQSNCSNKDCKMRVLCSGKKISRLRSKNFVNDSSSKCRTYSEEDRYNTRRDKFCYIHGANVWNFLNERIAENDIDDDDFKGDEKAITLDKCNRFCGRDDDDKVKNCGLVL